MEYRRSFNTEGGVPKARRAMLHEASMISSVDKLHHASFRLTDKEVENAEKACWKMKCPSHWDVRGDYFTNSGHVKAHEWYMFTACEVMDYCLLFSTHLGDRQKEAFLWFGKAWSSLHAKVL